MFYLVWPDLEISTGSDVSVLEFKSPSVGASLLDFSLIINTTYVD